MVVTVKGGDLEWASDRSATPAIDRSRPGLRSNPNALASAFHCLNNSPSFRPRLARRILVAEFGMERRIGGGRHVLIHRMDRDDGRPQACAWPGVVRIQPSPINSLMRRCSLRFFCSLLRSRSSRSEAGSSDRVAPLNATPMKLSRQQMILASKERPFCAMVSDIRPLGSLAALLNSRLAPRRFRQRRHRSSCRARSGVDPASTVLPDY
jgi:hypothetical protein